jgi:hypothetical protein
MADQDAVKLPTMKEIDAMVENVIGGSECTVLCHDLLNALETLAGPPPATGILRLRLLARIRALRAQMKALHCALCLPE